MLSPRLIILQPTSYCNLNCSYCYLGSRHVRTVMSADVVEAVREKILLRLDPDARPSIVWHAGEPTTVPIGWYEHAYRRLAGASPPGAGFALQTNGIAIDDRWIDLLRRWRTNVSLSIDGPRPFHDARRRTRSGAPTWDLAVRGLRRLQQAGFDPPVITVLHPAGLQQPEAYFEFYRSHDISQVSFSIDEVEGANRTSDLADPRAKDLVVAFMVRLLETAFAAGYPLHIKEVERISRILLSGEAVDNEQVDPWASIVVAADGKVSTFSPEFMETEAPEHHDFCFGNILDDDLDGMRDGEWFLRTAREVAEGVDACRRYCRYFPVCGGGSPVNKYAELGALTATETQFCRLSTQGSTDALLEFLRRRQGTLRPAHRTSETVHASG